MQFIAEIKDFHSKTLIELEIECEDIGEADTRARWYIRTHTIPNLVLNAVYEKSKTNGEVKKIYD